jgi:hypothetical protein
MIQAIEKLQIPHLWYWYIYFSLLFTLCMRVVFSYMRALAAKFDTPYEQRLHKEYYKAATCQKFSIIFWGNTDIEPFPDLWYNTLLGLIELLIFPILMRVGAINIIGAWMGLKTVAQWPAWQKNRLSFNRYLLANALQIILSFFLMNWFLQNDGNFAPIDI